MRTDLLAGARPAASMLLGALAASACNGQISRGASQPDVAGQAGSVTDGVAGASAAAGSTGAAGTGAAVASDVPGRTLVRRFSNAEYDATIAALLRDTTPRAPAFPADTAVHGFMNNSDVQDFGPALAEQYMITAEAIAAKATRSPDTLLGCKLADGGTWVST